LLLELEGIQSARVFRYSIWPGEVFVPPGVSREEESRLVLEYQAKWREESFSWTEFEKAITRECEQVLDIADAATRNFKRVGSAQATWTPQLHRVSRSVSRLSQWNCYKSSGW
jgi:hypothetical protein